MPDDDEKAGQRLARRGGHVCAYTECDRRVYTDAARGPLPEYCGHTWPDGLTCKQKAERQQDVLRDGGDLDSGLQALHAAREHIETALAEAAPTLTRLSENLQAAAAGAEALSEGLLQRVKTAEAEAHAARTERAEAMTELADQTQIAEAKTAEAAQARKEQEAAIAERDEAADAARRDRLARERVDGELAALRDQFAEERTRWLDERQAGQARISELERELAAAKETIATEKGAATELVKQLQRETERADAADEAARRTRADAEAARETIRAEAQAQIEQARAETERLRQEAGQQAERERGRDTEIGKLTERLESTHERLEQAEHQLTAQRRRTRVAVREALRELNDGQRDPAQIQARLEDLYYGDDAEESP